MFLEAYRALVQTLCSGVDEMTGVLDFLDSLDRLLQDDIDVCQIKAQVSLGFYSV